MVKYLILALKGCAMGMADVVPGVSGGTIAFISGIYEELLDSIRSIDAQALRLLFSGRFGALWRHVNGGFLASVLLGIAVAVFSLAHLMTYLLEHHPIGIWSFFFGLIVASALLVAREVGRWSAIPCCSLVAGIAAAWWIATVSPAQTPDTWWFVALSGAVAICAMILPGISGAFILLLLGKYQYILQAVSDLNLPVLLLFGAGAAAGILAFSHLLSWLLKRWRDATVALLMGFMLGSLNKVWPWKLPEEGNVLPGLYGEATGNDAQLGTALLLAAAGLLTILCVERFGAWIAAGRRTENDRNENSTKQ